MPSHSAPMLNAERKRLEGFLRGKARLSRAPLAAAIACGAANGLALIAQAWLIARAVDAVVIDGGALDAAWPWLSALLGVFVLRALATALGDVMAFEAGARVVIAVRAALQAHIVALGPAWTRRQRTGEVATPWSTAPRASGATTSATCRSAPWSPSSRSRSWPSWCRPTGCRR